MSVQKLTPERVYAEADALKAQGLRPTKSLIRKAVGPIGSDSTLCKALTGWRQIHELPAAAIPELTLPPAVQRVLVDHMASELAAARAPLAAELADQQQAVADLVDEGERNSAIIAEKDAQLAQLAAEKAAAEGRAGQLAADLAGAREDAGRERQAAEAIRTELAKAQLRLEALPRLDADLAALRETLATETRARIEAEQRAGILDAQKADLEARLRDAKQDVARLDEQLAAAREDIASERRSAETARAALAQAEQRAAVLGTQKADLDGRLGDAKQDIERHRAHLATAQASAEQLARSFNDRIQDLLAQIEEAKKDVDHARAAADATRNEAKMLRIKLDEMRIPDTRRGEANQM